MFAVLLVLAGAELGARVLWPELGDDDEYLHTLYRSTLNSLTTMGRKDPNFDPMLGFKHQPNVRRIVSTPEFEYTVATNSLGFRTREFEPRRRHTYRVVLLGDSMLEGVGTAEDERLANQLTRLWNEDDNGPRLDVYNLAVRGYNTVQELAVLRRYGTELAPDRVILGFFVANDFLPSHIGTLTPQGHYGMSEQRIAEVKTWLRETHPGPLWNSRLFRLLNLRGYAVRTRYRLSQRPQVLASTCGWVEALALETRALGAVLDVVVFYPRHAVHDGLLARWSGSRQAGRGVAQCARAAGVEVIDLIEIMSGPENAKQYYWTEDGHFNAAGERKVAEILLEHLRARPSPGST